MHSSRVSASQGCSGNGECSTGLPDAGDDFGCGGDAECVMRMRLSSAFIPPGLTATITASASASTTALNDRLSHPSFTLGAGLRPGNAAESAGAQNENENGTGDVEVDSEVQFIQPDPLNPFVSDRVGATNANTPDESTLDPSITTVHDRIGEEVSSELFSSPSEHDLVAVPVLEQEDGELVSAVSTAVVEPVRSGDVMNRVGGVGEGEGEGDLYTGPLSSDALARVRGGAGLLAVGVVGAMVVFA